MTCQFLKSFFSGFSQSFILALAQSEVTWHWHVALKTSHSVMLREWSRWRDDGRDVDRCVRTAACLVLVNTATYFKAVKTVVLAHGAMGTVFV